MKAKEIINILERIAPSKLIDSWDNTGFQIGNEDKDINRILISLDLDEYIVNKAIEENFQMIITHHPLIFKPLKNINANNYLGKLIMKIISHDIVVYNAHSNLDLANGGVNDELAKVLGICNVRPLSDVIIDGETYGYGRIGEIDNNDPLTFFEHIKTSLSIEDLRVYGDINKKINTIAVCGGSGSDFIKDAYNKGADVYITGDVKYHDAQLALQLGLIIVDAGHFHTEKIILPRLKNIILDEIYDIVEVVVNMNTSVSYKIY
ncbi:Nif3-like dinuclear metal center hexameric protein [Tissierella sp. Yu-01]|uniref:Nif3-like dinuclear metal center hexameric protein n=1 Tax=Tissierella sp. Yu-01 TaxID=3035694 RepID=UPI00240D513C|nr:Nif3-like dinuclear metal center hexameric protein [Tissierella sp. Yu-01]WFA09565.1 Nif3-like dinuclear metal center hexameric protein [Tissierella sp. Yu-01]